VIVVLDSTKLLTRDESDHIERAAEHFVRAMGFRHGSASAVGVVEYNGRARTLCGLTNSQDQAVSCIRRRILDTGSRPDLGLREAGRLLAQGRRRSSETPRAVVVLISTRPCDVGCDPLLMAANQVKGTGAGLFTVCTGPNCDAACLNGAASSPRHYGASPFDGLGAHLDTVRTEVQRASFGALDVSLTLDPAFTYVPGSAVPPAVTAPPELRWTAVAPLAVTEFSFAVTPNRPGSHRVDLTGAALFAPHGSVSDRPVLEVLRSARLLVVGSARP
jgi:hypothetical protein